MRTSEENNMPLWAGVLLILLILIATFSLTIYGAYRLNILNIGNLIDQRLSSFTFVRNRVEKNQNESTERQRMIEEIAIHYNTKDWTYVSETMYAIKLKDETLYQDILRKLDQRLAREVVQTVSSKERRKDYLTAIYEEVQNSKDERLEEMIKFYQKMDPTVAAQVITDEVSSNPNVIPDLSRVLLGLRTQQVVPILSLLDDSLRREIISKASIDVKEEINKQLIIYNDKIEQLKKKSYIYQTMESKKASLEIGNLNNYNLRDLSVIYEELDPLKSADILFYTEPEFRISLLNSLKPSLTMIISNELENIINYRQRIRELAQVYERMEAKDSSMLLESLYREDQALVIDVIRLIKPNTAAQIMRLMDSKVATEIAKKLTLTN